MQTGYERGIGIEICIVEGQVEIFKTSLQHLEIQPNVDADSDPTNPPDKPPSPPTEPPPDLLNTEPEMFVKPDEASDWIEAQIKDDVDDTSIDSLFGRIKEEFEQLNEHERTLVWDDYTAMTGCEDIPG